MQKDIELLEAAGSDPVLANIPLPLRATFYPLGFPAEIHTNSDEVLTAARESWGKYKHEFRERAVEVRVCVTADEGECSGTPVFRAQGHLFSIVSDSRTFASCDMRQGFAYCCTTPATVQNRPFFRFHFLEAMTLVLLDQLYWTPVHAACVEHNGKGVLLCAESGTGKSSLALACARDGWTFLSDDAAVLLRGRRDRTVVGQPHSMRFRPSARELFPDLSERLLTVRGNGKVGIELPTGELGIRTATQTTVDYMIFLHRRPSGPARLEHFSKADAYDRLAQVARYGEQEVRNAQLESLRTLLAAPVYALSYSDLGSAVARLKSLVETGID